MRMTQGYPFEFNEAGGPTTRVAVDCHLARTEVARPYFKDTDHDP
jgi:hypothetical protein